MPAAKDYDPSDYRMTVGEHLEELRRRLVYALVGFFLVLVGCLFFGRQVTSAFCAPLIDTLQARNLNPQVYFTDVSDAFMVYIKISLVSAAAIASPWLAYQVWLFVAAGLYPHERKWVMRYLPLSITLLVVGMLFVYFLVLPWTIAFFIGFGEDIPLPDAFETAGRTVDVAGTPLAALDGDPARLDVPQTWYNTVEHRWKIFTGTEVRVVPFGPTNLTAPLITLPHYIDLVLGMLVTFGLAFQLPLVVAFVARIGLVDVEALRAGRRYVYFILAIAAAVISPGDAITVTLALTFPLIALYEFGIYLAQWGADRPAAPR